MTMSQVLLRLFQDTSAAAAAAAAADRLGVHFALSAPLPRFGADLQVFLRDPAERLLSGYLDKLQNTDSNIRAHFNRMLGQPADHNMSFAEFVDTVLADERDGDCLNTRHEFHR